MKDWILVAVRTALFLLIGYGLYLTLSGSAFQPTLFDKKHKAVVVKDDIQTLLALYEKHQDNKGLNLINSICRDEDALYSISTTSGYVICKERTPIEAIRAYEQFWKKHLVNGEEPDQLQAVTRDIGGAEEVIFVSTTITASQTKALANYKKKIWVHIEKEEGTSSRCRISNESFERLNDTYRVSVGDKGCRQVPRLVSMGRKVTLTKGLTLPKKGSQYGSLQIADVYNWKTDKVFYLKHATSSIYAPKASKPIEAFLKQAVGINRTDNWRMAQGLVLESAKGVIDSLLLTNAKAAVLLEIKAGQQESWRSFFNTLQIQMQKNEVSGKEANREVLDLSKTAFIKRAYVGGNLGDADISLPIEFSLKGEAVEPILFTKSGTPAVSRIAFGDLTFFVPHFTLGSFNEEVTKSDVFVPLLYSILAGTAEEKQNGSIMASSLERLTRQGSVNRLRLPQTPAIVQAETGVALGYFAIETRNHLIDTVAVNLYEVPDVQALANIADGFDEVEYEKLRDSVRISGLSTLSSQKIPKWIFVAIIALCLFELMALLLKK